MTKDYPTVRIGIIGTGQIGTHHVETYSTKVEGAQIVALCDIDIPKVEMVAEKFGVSDIYPDFRELLKRDDIDAVDVALHNNLHRPVTQAALEAGKHVYCEKPMAGTYIDALAMYETSVVTGKNLSIQLSTLFSKEIRAAREIIDQGRLGNIYHARSAGFRRRGRPYVDGYGSQNFVQKEISAGGALYDMGVYHIASMLYLLGNPLVDKVTGKIYQETPIDPERKKESGYNVEELGVGFVRFANNISMDIIESWAIHLDKLEGSTVVGSTGGIRIDPFGFFWNEGDLAMSSTGDLGDFAWRKGSIRKNDDAYASPQHHWVAALQGRVPLLPTAELAMNTMLISEGFYLSEKLGREVSADEIKELSNSTALEV